MNSEQQTMVDHATNLLKYKGMIDMSFVNQVSKTVFIKKSVMSTFTDVVLTQTLLHAATLESKISNVVVRGTVSTINSII